MNDLLYRWEDTPALEHKCGICHTVLSAPKARKTCFGIHEEVCCNYHKTRLSIGEAHKCDACKRGLEQHDKRHKEIAVILKEARIHDDDEPGSKATPTKPSKANLGRDVIKREEVELVASILHPSSTGRRDSLVASPGDSQADPISDANVIANNLYFQSRLFEYHKVPRSLRKPDVVGGEDHSKSQDEAIPRLLKEFNLLNLSDHGSRFAGNVLTKLESAIRLDYQILDNERAERMKRMAGYYRYVNRKTYNNMIRNNLLWDWQTGEKYPECPEDDEEEKSLNVGAGDGDGGVLAEQHPAAQDPPAAYNGVKDERVGGRVIKTKEADIPDDASGQNRKPPRIKKRAFLPLDLIEKGSKKTNRRRKKKDSSVISEELVQSSRYGRYTILGDLPSSS